MHHSISALVGIAAISGSFSQASFGCEFLALMPHSIEAAERAIDDQAPGRVESQLVVLWPGNGDDLLSDTDAVCVGDAMVEIQILSAEDDRTQPADMGYRLILIDGELPEDAYFPQEPVRAYDGFLYVLWGVGRFEPIRAVDFTIVIAAVDRAGNEGPRSEPIRIRHIRIER